MKEKKERYIKKLVARFCFKELQIYIFFSR